MRTRLLATASLVAALAMTALGGAAVGTSHALHRVMADNGVISTNDGGVISANEGGVISTNDNGVINSNDNGVINADDGGVVNSRD